MHGNRTKLLATKSEGKRNAEAESGMVVMALLVQPLHDKTAGRLAQAVFYLPFLCCIGLPFIHLYRL